MIFYFTGTGNSLFAAKKLLGSNEKLISMADAVEKGNYEYEVPEGEKVGFVFPVYFYTLPSIVRKFAEKAAIKNAGYVYAVITCGGGTGQSSHVLKKVLHKNGLELSYFAELLMPDNAMLYYQIPGMATYKERSEKAELKLREIIKDIEAGKKSKIGSITVTAGVVGMFYNKKTSKFRVNEKCTGCGMCERNCPEKVIKLKDGRPEWVKDKCVKCTACINRCPVQAIQYGRSEKRNRYVHPELH